MSLPYKILIFFLAACAILFLVSIVPERTAHAPTSPFSHAQGYYTSTENLGIVRVIPLAGPILESPSVDSAPLKALGQ